MTDTPTQTGSVNPQIVSALVDYVLSQHPTKYTAETLPREESLLALGVIDSAGVIELIVFVESNWNIEIPDDDITTERIGSLNKIALLIEEYTAGRGN